MYTPHVHTTHMHTTCIIHHCRFKLLKWWVQSFLIGVPKIVCGFRDDSGIVQKLETFRTLDIPKQLQVRREGREGKRRDCKSVHREGGGERLISQVMASAVCYLGNSC